MVDYLIVGLGLAGISFCETLEKNKRSFMVVNDSSQTSSLVAAGLYNPVILKRFTLAWKAREQLELTGTFYPELEKKLNTILDHKIPVLRRFNSVEEQNNWFQAADSQQLEPFLSAKIIKELHPSINAPYGFGQVLGTGRVDTQKLISLYTTYLLQKEVMQQETFDFGALSTSGDYLEYRSVKAKHIVFAEGFGLRQNPLFNYLPLTGTKGELLKIRAPQLNLKSIVKSSVFLIPLPGNYYKVGATYKWKDKTNTPTQEAKSELLANLQTFLKHKYTVEAHLAGIRPTVTDRRPLLGRHPEHKNMYVFNGLGSRGVMIGPYAARQLFNLIEMEEPLDPEIDIARFAHKYGSN